MEIMDLSHDECRCLLYLQAVRMLSSRYSMPDVGCHHHRQRHCRNNRTLVATPSRVAGATGSHADMLRVSESLTRVP